ncbi:methyltransferase domain-containing protein [Saccharolobus solfataricus]|uniref:Methyltransferase type 11 domain-containing protein n=2 Tax=Saccharolobus solfataricus TaxID=2287 RepID=Q97UP1_SACS2|nr:class I SAM-dependent methyltransferase [Saccharolobus solfataricus]AAK43067.1 Hypothetical protein SSO2963 [Saccharolobus solfataricus P2]QPG50112.1 methyltransferase domain-containing protein [Saccharolobus solfataricus]SAI86616.1 methyltransferase type 11 [Saccharolobus solfataricus]
MSMFENTHPELTRIGIRIENVDSRYKPLMRMGISIDEMIYLARRLYPLIRDGKRILDLGCGNGLITVILSKLISEAEFHAVDDWKKVSRDDLIKNIEIDKAKIALGEFTDQFTLSYQDTYFDFVYSVMFLSNIGKDGRTKISDEVHRVLKEKGKFVVIDTLVFRGKIKKDLGDKFKLDWYGEENGFSFFVWSK